MDSEILYSDKLIKITDNQIHFNDYYYPFGSKQINLSEIEYIILKSPTLWNGKWRIYGTGDFRTWFPFDGNRSKRDKIFVITLKNRWRRIGFTAENSEAVINIFKNKNLIIKYLQ